MASDFWKALLAGVVGGAARGIPQGMMYANQQDLGERSLDLEQQRLGIDRAIADALNEARMAQAEYDRARAGSFGAPAPNEKLQQARDFIATLKALGATDKQATMTAIESLTDGLGLAGPSVEAGTPGSGSPLPPSSPTPTPAPRGPAPSPAAQQMPTGGLDAMFDAGYGKVSQLPSEIRSHPQFPAIQHLLQAEQIPQEMRQRAAEMLSEPEITDADINEILRVLSAAYAVSYQR